MAGFYGCLDVELAVWMSSNALWILWDYLSMVGGAMVGGAMVGGAMVGGVMVGGLSSEVVELTDWFGWLYLDCCRLTGN